MDLNERLTEHIKLQNKHNPGTRGCNMHWVKTAVIQSFHAIVA